MYIATNDYILKLTADKLLHLLLRDCSFFHAENISIIDKFSLQKMF